MNNVRDVELLARARALLRQISESTDNPAVYQAVTIADTNLHWACWHLGSVDEIMPQLEGVEGQPR